MCVNSRFSKIRSYFISQYSSHDYVRSSMLSTNDGAYIYIVRIHKHKLAIIYS